MKCLLCKHSTITEREIPERCELCRNNSQFEEMTLQDVVEMCEQLYKMKLKRLPNYSEYAKSVLHQDCINEAMMQYNTAIKYKEGLEKWH